MHLTWLTSLALFVASTAAVRSPRPIEKVERGSIVERQSATSCRPGLILYAKNKSPRYLRLGRCVDQCPEGTYIQPDTRNCLGCTGLFSFSTACTPTAATACRAPRVLVNGACVEASTCAAGSFLNTATNASVKCTDTNALTCNSTVSLTCKPNFSIISGRCSAGCASTEYLDGSTCKSCVDLFPSALTCTKAAATSCGGTTSLNNGTCISPCPTKTFANATNVCTACADADALTCNSTVALSCDTMFLRANSTCGACPTGFRGETSNRQCVACAANAATCTSTAISTCLPGFSLTGGACVSTSTCATGQYRDSARNVCVSCNELGSNILACTESAGATSCSNGFTPIDGECGCPAGSFINTPSSCQNKRDLDECKRAPAEAPTCVLCSSVYGDLNVATCDAQGRVLSCKPNTYFVYDDEIDDGRCSEGKPYFIVTGVEASDYAKVYQQTVVEVDPLVNVEDCIAGGLAADAFVFFYRQVFDSEGTSTEQFCPRLTASKGLAVTSYTPRSFDLLTFTTEEQQNTNRYTFVKGSCEDDGAGVLFESAYSTAGVKGSIPPGTSCRDTVLIGENAYLLQETSSDPTEPLDTLSQVSFGQQLILIPSGR